MVPPLPDELRSSLKLKSFHENQGPDERKELWIGMVGWRFNVVGQ